MQHACICWLHSISNYHVYRSIGHTLLRICQKLLHYAESHNVFGLCTFINIYAQNKDMRTLKVMSVHCYVHLLSSMLDVLIISLHHRKEQNLFKNTQEFQVFKCKHTDYIGQTCPSLIFYHKFLI